MTQEQYEAFIAELAALGNTAPVVIVTTDRKAAVWEALNNTQPPRYTQEDALIDAYDRIYKEA